MSTWAAGSGMRRELPQGVSISMSGWPTQDGRLLGYELLVDANVGAYPHTDAPIPASTGAMSTGCYATPRVFARARTVVPSTPPTSAYRGAGRPEHIDMPLTPEAAWKASRGA